MDVRAYHFLFSLNPRHILSLRTLRSINFLHSWPLANTFRQSELTASQAASVRASTFARIISDKCSENTSLKEPTPLIMMKCKCNCRKCVRKYRKELEGGLNHIIKRVVAGDKVKDETVDRFIKNKTSINSFFIWLSRARLRHTYQTGWKPNAARPHGYKKVERTVKNAILTRK